MVRFLQLHRRRLCIIMTVFFVSYLIFMYRIQYYNYHFPKPLESIAAKPYNLFANNVFKQSQPGHQVLDLPPSHIKPRALVVKASNHETSVGSKLLVTFLEYQRIYSLLIGPNVLPEIIHQLMHSSEIDVSINLVVFEDFRVYFALPSDAKNLMDNFCRKNGVGIIGFFKDLGGIPELEDVPGFVEIDKSYPLLLRPFPRDTLAQPKGFYLSNDCNILRIARRGHGDDQPLDDPLVSCERRRCLPCSHLRQGYPSDNPINVSQSCSSMWATLVPRDDKHFKSVAFTQTPLGSGIFGRHNCISKSLLNNPKKSVQEQKLVEDGQIYQSLVMEDVGLIDGIRRVLFSFEPTQHWSTSLLFADAVQYFLRKTASLTYDPGLARYVHIDIDDVFVASRGTRMTTADVQISTALLRLLRGAEDHVRTSNGTTQLCASVTEVKGHRLERVRHRIKIEDLMHLIPRPVIGVTVALVHIQDRWRQFVPGFTFHLGFVGQSYNNSSSGNPDDQVANKALMQNRHHFKWFCHTWGHTQPHLLSSGRMLEQLLQNRAFAKKHDLPIAKGYAVAPSHSGVFPVMPHLYNAWRSVWNINVTTTDRYPRLYPSHQRRGFRYKNIQVLPRQSFGVFNTNTTPFRADHLQSMDLVWEVFETLLFNPVNLYKTNLGNYAHGRIAPEVFGRVFDFLRSWTNLQLKTAPLPTLVAHYLTFNPQESSSSPSTAMPLHSDPCVDRHHAAIWPTYRCTSRGHKLPQLLGLGPPKTGSTALLAFMAMHPDLIPNHILKTYPFEELCFFNDNHTYAKGVAFYNERFPDKRSASETAMYFEKSPPYFASPEAPMRASALVPSAKLIVMLREPMQRALSWYHHERSFHDIAADVFSFEDALRASSLDKATEIAESYVLANKLNKNTNFTRIIQRLHQLYIMCVKPSRYAEHLQNWLIYYKAQNILLVDSERVVSDPASVMQVIQEFLQTNRTIDYSTLLTRNPEKGFFCAKGGPYPAAGHLLQARGTNQWCLSEQKGRHYNRSHAQAVAESTRLFEADNRALASLLMQQPFWRPRNSQTPTDLLPQWLRTL